MSGAPNREQPSRTFRRRLARITREADARLAELRRREAGAKGRRLVGAELLGMAEALADPVLGSQALEAVLAAYGAARGVSGGAMCECLTCRGLWTADRAPAAVRITISKPHSVMLAMVCPTCVRVGRAGFEAALGQALERDFFAGGPVERVSPAMVAPGGRA